MKVLAWRIVKTKYASDAFSGEGARRFGGRWNSPGTAIVYTSEYASLSILEILVHLDSVSPLPSYSVIKIEFDDTLLEIYNPDDLPLNWMDHPPSSTNQSIGDQWARDLRTAVLKLPSAILQSEHNYLINPNHPDFPQINIGLPEPLSLDPRLLR